MRKTVILAPYYEQRVSKHTMWCDASCENARRASWRNITRGVLGKATSVKALIERAQAVTRAAGGGGADLCDSCTGFIEVIGWA